MINAKKIKPYFLCVSLSLVLPLQLWANSFKVERWRLDNGTRVVFYQAVEVPILDVTIAFKAGSANDGDKFGLAALTVNLLNQGNAGLTANEVAEGLADQGAQFGSEALKDMAVLTLRTLTEEKALKSSTDLLSKITNQPDFPLEAFERTKNQQLVALQQMLESPDQVADDAFYKNLYPKHPYGHPVLGNPNTVAKLTVNDVRQFYKTFYVGQNAVLTLVGAISSIQAHEIAEKLAKKLPAGQQSPPIPKAQPLTKNETVTIPFPASQTALRIGQLGVDHNSPDFFPLVVGNYILGGGVMVSRLAEEVREKRGLTYGVYSQFLPMPGNGPFLISLSTKSSQAEDALKLTQEVVAEFIKSGPHESELADAKDYLTGSFPLSLASNRKIADILLKITFYNLPDDYLDNYLARIRAVTIKDIKLAFEKTLNPQAYLVVKVGPKS